MLTALVLISSVCAKHFLIQTEDGMNPKKKLGFLKGREKDKDHKGKNKPAKKEYGSDYADYCNACTCCGGGDDTYGVPPVEKHFGGGFHSSRRSSKKSEYEYYDSGWVNGGGIDISNVGGIP